MVGRNAWKRRGMRHVTVPRGRELSDNALRLLKNIDRGRRSGRINEGLAKKIVRFVLELDGKKERLPGNLRGFWHIFDELVPDSFRVNGAPGAVGVRKKFSGVYGNSDSYFSLLLNQRRISGNQQTDLRRAVRRFGRIWRADKNAESGQKVLLDLSKRLADCVLENSGAGREELGAVITGFHRELIGRTRKPVSKN